MKTSCSGVITSVCAGCLSLEAATVQLDFLSWHIYSNDPNDYIKGARHCRACLDSSGYTNTELHVTEYNTDNRSDNDVASNWAEFTAGTNPTNPMSRLQIDTISAVSGNILLQWTAVTGRTYRVQTAPDINSPELWRDVSTDIQAGSFIHSNVTSQTQFYRLQVLEP